MAKIHSIQQGKGGVGKSFVATNLAQYKISKGQKPTCVCTDPVNATFAGFKALDVKRIEIMEKNKIIPRRFDELIEIIAGTKDNDVIIDNGASSFVPLSHYIISNDIPTLIKDMGHELIIHTIVVGGQSLLDTVNGFAQIATQYPENIEFVVWLNPFWGEVKHDSKSFQQMKAYTSNKDRVSAIINIPELTEEQEEDLSKILKGRLTYEEALATDSLTIMERQRLTIVRRQLFSQLDNAVVL